jgi:hypothetical protein
MKLIQLVLICFLFISSFSATAQDIIKMKDSSEVKARVEKVTPTDITYKRAVDTAGPVIVVYRQDVESITYANGEKDMMDKGTYAVPNVRGTHHHPWITSNKNITHGRNILSLAFLQATEESTGGGDGGGTTYPGIGLHYEYMLTKKQNISLYLPFTMSLYSFYGLNNYNSDEVNNQIHPFFYAYPGVKFYPWGSERRVSYSIGPSIALGFGEKYYYGSSYDSTGDYTTSSVRKSVFKTGLMINNGINIMPKEHLYLGMELGLGFTVYTNDFAYTDYSTTPNSNGTFIVQFNMKAGYRF